MALEVISTLRRYTSEQVNQLLEHLSTFSRCCVFQVLSMGPIPNHIAFIMDGNRRYAKNRGLEVGTGHKAGFSALMSVLKYCYELGVKYLTIYAFSIENFKRSPDEVRSLMDLMLEKIESLLDNDSLVNKYGIRVYFIGNLKLLSQPVGAAAEKVMKVTAQNSRAVLIVCVAYTSLDEIVHAVEQSCQNRFMAIQESTGRMNSSIGIPGKVENGAKEGCEESNRPEHDLTINLVDIDRNMRMAVAPNPDILIRSSGETRLSNFLLWQTSHCPLYSPAALWPEIGLWHLVWAILNFQRSFSYLEKRKKLL